MQHMSTFLLSLSANSFSQTIWAAAGVLSSWQCRRCGIEGRACGRRQRQLELLSSFLAPEKIELLLWTRKFEIFLRYVWHPAFHLCKHVSNPQHLGQTKAEIKFWIRGLLIGKLHWSPKKLLKAKNCGCQSWAVDILILKGKESRNFTIQRSESIMKHPRELKVETHSHW